MDVDETLTSTAEGKAARDELARKQREAQAKIQPLLERLESRWWRDVLYRYTGE